MKYSSLRPAELEHQVKEEIESFVLPPDWREGRRRVAGYAIDKAITKDVDDAINLESKESGDLVTVSIADVASFLSQPSAMRTLARRRGETIYKRDNIERSIWPREISQDLLSLRDGQERPVIAVQIPINEDGIAGPAKIEKSIIKAQRLTHSQAEHSFTEDQPIDEASASLQRLMRIARLANWARQKEKGNFQHNLAEQRSEFLVEEMMILANRVLAQFMVDNEIPGLFRVPTNDKLSGLSPVKYSVELAENAIPYIHGTSPLRRFADFACQANILAFLEGSQNYPYNETKLGYVATSLNEQQDKAYRQNFRKYKRLAEYLESGQADIGACIRGIQASGNILGAGEVRRAALDFLVKKPHHARQVLNTLISQGKLELRRSRESDFVDTTWVVEDKNGFVYPYHKNKKAIQSNASKTAKVRQQFSDAKTLALVSGVESSSQLPWYLNDEANDIFDSAKELEKIHNKKPIGLQFNQQENPDGSVTAWVYVLANKEIKEASATESNELLAKSLASHKLLQEINAHEIAVKEQEEQKMDPELLELRKFKSKKGHNHGPRHYLVGHLRKTLKDPSYLPEYVLQTAPDANNGQSTTCILTIRTPEEKQITATSTGGKRAKDLAALRAMKMLGLKIN